VKETVTPESRCLYCHHRFDRCTSVEDNKKTKPGDLTLCISCSCVMAFDSDMRVRPMTPEELDDLRSDRRMLEIVERTTRAIRAVNARMPRN
jgi:hypothetical protein